jgi:hypothetical protein
MRHRKFARLARLIGSEVLARGHLELLWEVAYENGDDLVGDAGDLEHLVKWTGETGNLASALVESGFVDLDGDRYRVHDLWDHAPDYVRKRRQRESERQTKGSGLQSLTGQSPPNGSHCPPNGRPRAPAPAPSQQQQAAAGKSNTPAGDHSKTKQLLEALAARGWILTQPAAEKRQAFEATLGAGIEATLAFVVQDLEERAKHQQEIPGSLGFYLGDSSTLAKRAAAPKEQAAPKPPVLDLSWLDQLPEPSRSEARAAWAAKQAEVESLFMPGAVPRILANSADALRQQFSRRTLEATA